MARTRSNPPRHNPPPVQPLVLLVSGTILLVVGVVLLTVGHS